MVLPTNYTDSSKLGHIEFNEFDATINNSVVSVATAGTNIANTQTNIATTQQISTTTQSGIVTLQQKTTAQQSTLTTANATLTSINNRLTVLETATPPPAVPNVPASITSGTITTTSVALTLTAPVGGATPTGYTFRRSPAGTGTWVDGPSGAGLTGTVTGLTQGTAYDFAGFAFNAAGPGPVIPSIRRTTATAATPSPAWTEMPPATSIIMDDGGVVTVVNGIIYLNGSAMGDTDQVILIVKSGNGRIYQENAIFDWWYWDPLQTDPWVFSSDPRGNPPVSGSPGTGPSVRTPVNGQNIGNGDIASSGISVVPTAATGETEVQIKTYWHFHFNRAGQTGNLLNGITAAFIDRGIYLDTPDVPHETYANGLPATDGVIPVSWITAGPGTTTPVAWQLYVEPNPFTNIYTIIVDYNPSRGDTFTVTPNLKDGSGNLRGVFTTMSWGSWIDFSAIGMGWLAFLNYNMTAGQVGNRAF